MPRVWIPNDLLPHPIPANLSIVRWMPCIVKCVQLYEGDPLLLPHDS